MGRLRLSERALNSFSSDLLVYASDYYLDPVAGNDLKSGRAPNTAWKTWGKASSTLPSGVRLWIKKGTVLREAITIPQSGISLGAYGTGDDPRITGTEVITGFSDAGASAGNTYVVSLATEPKFVFEDGNPLAVQASISAVEAGSGRWFYSGTNLFMRPDTVTDPASATIEAAQRNNLTGTLGVTGCSFNGLRFDGCNQIALRLNEAVNLTDCQIKFTNWYGLWNWEGGSKVNGVRLSGCTFHQAGIAGGFAAIRFWGNSGYMLGNSMSESRCFVEFTDVAAAHCSGYQLLSNYFGSNLATSQTNGGILFDGNTHGVFSTGDVHTDIVVARNRFHNIHGRIIDGATERLVLTYNLLTGSYASGADYIPIEINGNSALVVGNTVYLDKANIGMMINTDPHAIDATKQSRVLNNVFRIGTVNHIAYVDNDNSLTPEFSANIYWTGASGTSQYYARTKDISLAEWQASGIGSTPLDSTAREINPQMGASGYLASNSPALSGGTSAVGSYTVNFDGQDLSADASWAVGSRKAALPPVVSAVTATIVASLDSGYAFFFDTAGALDFSPYADEPDFTVTLTDGAAKTATGVPGHAGSGAAGGTLASNKLLNGDFNNWTADDPDNWTVFRASAENSQLMVTEVSGECRILTSGAYLAITQSPLTSNYLYIVSTYLSFVLGGIEFLQLAGGTIATRSTTGKWSKYRTSKGADLQLKRSGATDVTIPYVYAKQVTEPPGPATGAAGLWAAGGWTVAAGFDAGNITQVTIAL